MTVAILPSGTTPEEIAAIDGVSPGLLSAGLDEVPALQTYLDITQGNRVSESLYDANLPPIAHGAREGDYWDEVRARAEDAPADIEPGLLAQAIRSAGSTIAADRRARAAIVIAADEEGRVDFGGRPDVLVRIASLEAFAALVNRRFSDDLLIAFAAPPPEDREQLAIAVAGPGFNGNLTSDSTRTDGYVLTTDLAPTILDHLGIGVPDAMSGSPIEAPGEVDVDAINDLRERFGEIADLRVSILAAAVAAWLLVTGVVLLVSRDRLARPALQLLALAVIWMPLASLIGHAFGSADWVERIIVFGLPPLLAFGTRRLLPGYRGLAVACLATAGAYAVDVIAGSPLTAQSLMGPTPGLGVRFYGIGNTLEATLVPLVIGGTGAALAAWAPRLSPRGAAAAFLGAGLLAAVIFAAGRFGADVGAAIVFPVAAATAAILIVKGSDPLTVRRLWLIVLVPAALLVVVALVDLASGGDAHLTRSVLEAGSLEELAEVAERRLTLSAQTFEDAITSPFLPVTLVLIGLAVWQRDRLRGWLDRPQFRAAWAGVAVATLVGAVANDSGALLLMVGTAYAFALAAFAWAEA